MDANTRTTHSLSTAREEFTVQRGYLAACTVGPSTRSTAAALREDSQASQLGRIDVAHYTDAVERARASFARLVGVGVDRVAIGSQASVSVGLVAASLPEGAEVLVADGDFSSIHLPFSYAPQGLRVRTAPVGELADATRPETALVAFSLVQSATGEVADVSAISAAARRNGTRTLCDATQAVGWLPVDATTVDALICHTYKWLCAPRGVSFLTVSEDFARDLPPIHAGWYAGAAPWDTCYGGAGPLAQSARRFDVSPAWQAFVGAEPVLALFAGLDTNALYSHATGLAARFEERMNLTRATPPSAIVTWADSDGRALSLLSDAGITASGRAGRARVAFHLFNDEEDVELALRALGR